MYIITIDSGTTNTRVKVWDKEKVIAMSSVEAGVRDTAITGSRQTLQEGVKTALTDAVSLAGIKKEEIGLILASGMITSNVGLHEVPHVQAPAGIRELAAGMQKAVIPEVIDLPIWFVPGIKNNVRDIDLENCEAMDIMRGEETEAVGIFHCLELKGPALVFLPGSHSKFISVDGNSRITGCITSMAGEILSVITKKTILSSSLNSSFSKDVNKKIVLKGAEYAQKLGLNRACFMVRIIDLFTEYTTDEKANFLEGAILGTDLLAVKNSSAFKIDPEIPVVLGGSKGLKRIFELLVKNDSYFKGEIKLVEDELMKDMAGFGAILVARERGLA